MTQNLAPVDPALTARPVGLIHSRPINVDAIIPRDIVALINPDRIDEPITVMAVTMVDDTWIYAAHPSYYDYDKAAGRQWELVYRPNWPRSSLAPYRVRPWQRAALEQDGPAGAAVLAASDDRYGAGL